MLVMKETFLPSLSFFPYQIHQQILLPFPPTHILAPSIAILLTSTPLDQTSVLELMNMAVFQ